MKFNALDSRSIIILAVAGIMLLLVALWTIAPIALLLLFVAPFAALFLSMSRRLEENKLQRDLIFGLMFLSFVCWLIIATKEPFHWNFFGKLFFDGEMTTETITKYGENDSEWLEEITFFKPSTKNPAKTISYFRNGVMIYLGASLFLCYNLLPSNKD